MPQTPNIINRVTALFTEQYVPYVKEAVLWLEVYSGEKSKRAVYELRDALDHIAIAVQSGISEEKAIKSLDAAEEHFRRAVVEPAEWIALEELRRLLKIKNKGFWWWKFFLLRAPDSKEFNEKIYKAQEFITQGRHYKGVSIKDSYDNFKKAYILLHELLDEVKPAELNSRIFAFILLLVGAILSWGIWKLLDLGWRYILSLPRH
ncbi:MAG: hypothetical protein V1670_06335 [Candidatus Omnitrophota bacterium]